MSAFTILFLLQLAAVPVLSPLGGVQPVGRPVWWDQHATGHLAPNHDPSERKSGVIDMEICTAIIWGNTRLYISCHPFVFFSADLFWPSRCIGYDSLASFAKL